LELLELFPLCAARLLLRGEHGAFVASEQMCAVELVRQGPGAAGYRAERAIAVIVLLARLRTLGDFEHSR
jgi:hypothetical protein